VENVEENEKKEKILVITTHGPDNPELAILPFIIANGATVLDYEVTISLQGPAVFLAKKDMVENIRCCKWTLSELVKKFIEAGGKILACSPCLQEREIKEEDLLDFVKATGAVDLIDLATKSSAVLTY